MWRYYLSITARGFVRHRLHCAINIVGLAIGLTCIISPFYFVAAAMVALLVAWTTVCGNTLRLARSSPVRALRYE